MSSQVASQPAVDKRAGIPLSVYVRAIVYGIAWVPPLCVTVFALKFEDLFNRLRDKAELPALTEWLMWFAWLNKTLLLSPSILVVVLFVLSDEGVAALLRRSRRERMYWMWFAGVFVAGILSTLVALAALLLPIVRMSPQI